MSGGGVGVRVVTSGVTPAGAVNEGVAIVRVCDVGVDEQQPAASLQQQLRYSVELSQPRQKCREDKQGMYVCVCSYFDDGK